MRTLLTLALPFIFLLTPLVAGFGWMPIGSQIPEVPDIGAYSGRWPSLPTSIEYYGSGVVIVPFRAHVRSYLHAGELPLWNPDAGIGQPFAAQGEGGPYSPLALLRALLPSSWSSAVTIGIVLLSALALTLFLRQLGLSEASSAFGGASWALSGALTLHLARDNIVDQLCMMPPLFLAATWAIRTRRAVAYALFSIVVCLHALAGFLQVGVNALLLLGSFVIMLSYLHEETTYARIRTALITLVFLVIGLVLASPYTLPILEVLGVAYNKNSPFLAFIPMPTANVVAFFFPLLFGQLLQGWLHGGYPEVADWNNLFAFGGSTLLFLTLIGFASLSKQARYQKSLFIFFALAMLFFIGRYVSYPPVAGINFLPILTQQSPKHTGGVIVFCLVVAASIASGWLRGTNRRRAAALIGVLFVVLSNSVLTIIGRFGGRMDVDLPAALLYVSITLVISLIVLVALWCAQSARTDADAVLIAATATVGELSIYLPLGNGDPAVIGCRVGILALVVLAGLLVVRGVNYLAVGSGLLALGLYAGVLILPSTGLPNLFDVEHPPKYLTWLHSVAADDYRSFGIQPDYASIGNVQDIEAIGPIGTNEYMSFIQLIASPEMVQFVQNGSTFSLIHPVSGRPLYDIVQEYPRVRPVLDWFGVKYLVFNRRVYRPEASTVPEDLVSQMHDLVVSYDDDQATIIESPRAAPKAVFATAARPIDVPAEAIQQFQENPAAIDGPVLVEAKPSVLSKMSRNPTAPQIPIALDVYRADSLRATFDAPSRGVFVVKDSFFPGWQATLDGQPADVVRVNGMVRGVIIPNRGRHEITMQYRPLSFRAGVMLAAAALVFLAVVVISDRARGSRVVLQAAARVKRARRLAGSSAVSRAAVSRRPTARTGNS